LAGLLFSFCIGFFCFWLLIVCLLFFLSCSFFFFFFFFFFFGCAPNHIRSDLSDSLDLLFVLILLKFLAVSVSEPVDSARCARFSSVIGPFFVFSCFRAFGVCFAPFDCTAWPLRVSGVYFGAPFRRC